MIRIWNTNGEVIINRNPMQDTLKSFLGRGFGNVTFPSGANLSAQGGSGNLCIMELVVDRISQDKANELREFIAKNLRFNTNSFSILCESADLGYGVGMAVSGCYLRTEGDTKNYISRIGTFNKYTVRLPYEFWYISESGHGTHR